MRPARASSSAKQYLLWGGSVHLEVTRRCCAALAAHWPPYSEVGVQLTSPTSLPLRQRWGITALSTDPPNAEVLPVIPPTLKILRRSCAALAAHWPPYSEVGVQLTSPTSLPLRQVGAQPHVALSPLTQRCYRCYHLPSRCCGANSSAWRPSGRLTPSDKAGRLTA